MPAERYLADIVARALERRQRRAATDLEAHLDIMATQVVADTTAEDLDDAIDDALRHVRPLRAWQP